MKKYLMTWYGMTDFRASLGLEQTTGPVLGALLAEDYTDVIILGFTHPDKIENKIDEFHLKIKNVEGPNSEAARQFIDLFSNTGEAHHHFNEWLKQQLGDAGKKVDVRFHPVKLTHLNDTEGIYEAATQALNEVATSEDEKFVTLYLSPGTPVMAFVWAFAALRYPNLKKRLIASSQPGRPPERIILPNEWLEWHGKQVQTINMEPDNYDVIFHLFGEQRLPNLLGMMQFSSKKHIFLNSAQFPADVMRQFLGEAEYAEISVDPYHPENVRAQILELIENMPINTKIGFNLTGGTKLMYAGALAACRKVNATPFYFNGVDQKVIFLNDFTTKDIVKIESTETFLQLNGDGLKISEPGILNWDNAETQEKFEISKIIWNAKKKLTRNYKRIIPHRDDKSPFKVWDNEFYASLDSDYKAELHIDGHRFIFENFPEFSEFLVGGWFEIFIAGQLQPLVKKNKIFDLRVNLKVSIADLESNQNYKLYPPKYKEHSIYQEFDITFTDGYRLFIIECKSGNVTSDMVVKLHEIVKKYGGMDGVGCLISCYGPSHPIIKQKADDFSNISWVFGHDVISLLNSFINEKIKYAN
ncbi:DUF1887 family protein [Acinetobacter indicus]|uniref:DUF1887 family protein n=1 Tax=Acinetobacter TaxID=469 RepID=UPI0015D29540|nr:DUF1887 family protein [Acinetobacter sp. YH12069]